MGFLRYFYDVMRFMQLPSCRRRLTFYSEGKNYWPYLKGLLLKILDNSNVEICYISSDDDDPGVLLKHPNLQTFKIGEGILRNWFFENIDTEIMVMTMPDLNQYYIKRSKHKVHYVYIQHSLVSLHMAYRKGSFDFFDTIFCAGPHHVKEIKAMEQFYNLPKKNIVKQGYLLLEEIKQTGKRVVRKNDRMHILIAPSWGEDCIIESGIGEKIVDNLIERGCRVILRPHPQTIKFAKKQISKILKKYDKNSMFKYEDSIVGHESLFFSDFMVSDWSGAALDYAFGLKKPVVFIDVPKKVNNSDYDKINISPLEIDIRDKIGIVVQDENFSLEKIKKFTITEDIENLYFKNACENGMKFLINLLDNNSLKCFL